MTQKLDREHLDSIQELRTKFNQNAYDLGLLHIDVSIMQQRIEKAKTEQQRLVDEFTELQVTEEKLLTEMKDRYGAGSINIEDGTFTPEA
jgi:predicted transcriptional regulator